MAGEHDRVVVQGQEVIADRVDDRREVREGPPRGPRTAVEEGVAGEEHIKSRHVETARTRCVTRRVEHPQLDIAHGKGLTVCQLRVGRGLLCLVPQHAVRRVEVCRGTGVRHQFRHGVDVVVVAMRAEDSQDVPVADDRQDRHGFVRGIDDETLVVVTDDPDVVVNLPRAAVELEDPGGHDAFDADATRRDGEDGMGVGHAAYLFVSGGQSRTTTERSTSPSCILAKAASTSPMPIFSVTKAPRSKRPCL